MPPISLKSSLSLMLVLLSFSVSQALKNNASAPLATLRNGTLAGRHLEPPWEQDLFLGIPYAQPPVGPLRFKWPRSLTNNSWPSVRSASSYGSSCYQYGSTFTLSEDCLTLNVIRPGGNHSTPLPVLVWTYGGGLYAGSTADPQYNLSGIVRVSQDMGRPVIGVSMNYRLGVWGFLQSQQILAEGSSNAGLLDQRLAMRWVQENIQAFGGNPDRVTIWGESAGAQSIAYHLHSYDGRDDGLFQAAILESGGAVGAQVEPLAYYGAAVENLTRTAGCWTASDRLSCLRDLSSEDLFRAQQSTVWNPLIDGDFLTAYPSDLQREGKAVKVPMIVGANSDEGVSFGIKKVDNETAIFDSLLSYRNYAISPPSARKLLELYPEDLPAKPPYDVPADVVFPSNGLQWRRSAAICGDIVMIAGRRKLCEEFDGYNKDVYSYRFDTRLWNAAEADGVKHFVNVVFSFQNISGALGPLPQFQSYKDLSKSIGEAYVNFVNDHDPNGNRVGRMNDTVLPAWPKWTEANRVNMVLNASASFVEQDNFREDGINFINSIGRELLG
ncbi:MAG: hypothetical protein MMC23_004951 [Stictis urceolatum]|nr:hypothetical protein [Stictis urceolata]